MCAEETCRRSARGLRSGRGLRGTCVEERTLHERHGLERHERRKAVELRVDALQGSRDSFPVFLFIWVYVQMLVGRRTLTLWGTVTVGQESASNVWVTQRGRSVTGAVMVTTATLQAPDPKSANVRRFLCVYVRLFI